jgi:hypothetical protein
VKSSTLGKRFFAQTVSQPVPLYNVSESVGKSPFPPVCRAQVTGSDKTIALIEPKEIARLWKTLDFLESIMKKTILLGFAFLASFLSQGCVPVVTSAIAYDSAISHQRHAAYTEYLFAILAENRSLELAGKPTSPVMPEKEWQMEIYTPRLEYAAYYTRQTSSNAPIHSFEDWVRIDRPIEEKTRWTPDPHHRQ